MDMKYHPAHLWKRVVSLLSAAALALCLVAPAAAVPPEELPPFSYTPDPTVNIIFDTDIDSDVDDAGAMALLHSYVQQGKVNLLAVVGCCNSGYAAPCIDAINTYYGLPDVPVGIAPTSPGGGGSRYQQYIAQTYANDINSDYYAPSALEVYRRTLAAADDNSVVLVVVGTLNNLQDLLQSPADEISPLTGMELVRQKVKLCSIMAGYFPSGSENNMRFDAAASIYVESNCPVPILWSGWEIGSKIITGNTRSQMAEDDPVRKSYDLYFGNTTSGRESWDLTSLMYAVEGAGEWWDVETGTVTIDPKDGSNTWEADPNGKHGILVQKMDPAQVAAHINQQMTQAQKGESAETAWEIIDDADSRVTYSEGFRVNGTNPKRYNGTGHNYNLPGATVELTFTGIGIEIFGGMQFEHGKAEVYIDGELADTIDTYQANEVISTKIFRSGVLEDTEHTLQIKLLEEKSPQAAGTYTDIDYFRVIRTSPPEPPLPPDPELVAHWTFEAAEDGSMPDATGNGHSGAISGQPEIVSGLIGNAIRFNGGDQVITVPDADDLDFTATESFTLSTWVNVADYGNDWVTILRKGKDAGTGWYCLGLTSPQGGSAFNFGAHGNNNISNGVKAPLNQWVLMTAVQDGASGSRTLYLNGQAVANGVASGMENDSPLTLGASWNPERRENFTGLLDDVRIYNYALSAEEVAGLYRFKAVIDAIDAIGTVTLDSGAAIAAARDAYDALTEEEKALVSNYAVLTAAEEELARLQQAADQAAADEVKAKIDAIGTVTLDSGAAIAAARDAYDGLTDAQKKLVTNYNVLTAAEEQFAQLQLQAAADAVEAKIAAIGTVTLDSGTAIATARDAYDALPEDGKALVENYDVLLAAEKQLEELLQQAGDQAAAKAVMDRISAIGTVTLDSAAAIANTRDAYDALTDAQKALVTNYDVLLAAEERLAQLQQQAADQAAAKAVMDQIAAIGTVTLDSADAIARAREAYNGLTDAQKALVVNYEVLTAAEEQLAQLQQQGADRAAAKAVMDKIAAIGTVTLDSADAIADARAAYNGLTDAQKELVVNYDALVAAEKQLSRLQQQAADRAAADAVAAKIDAIGTVTLDSGAAIADARAAYDGLTDAQKALVTNYNELTAAEERLAQLQQQAADQAADQAAADGVKAKIDAIGTVTPDSGAAIAEARAAYDGLTDAQRALVTNYNVLTAAEERLAQLQQQAADQAAADAVKAKIDAIGTVTPDSGAAIADARAAYDGLTDAQKALVTNYSVLTAAEGTFAQLTKDAPADSHSPKTGDTAMVAVAAGALGVGLLAALLLLIPVIRRRLHRR